MKKHARECQRAHITYYLRVFSGRDFLGYLLDISREGFMLMSDYAADLNRIYSLKMKLPQTREWQTLAEEEKSIEFKAQCVRSRQDNENNNFYLSGFKFVELGEEENRTIGRMIREHKIK